MASFRFDRFLELVTSPQMVWGTVGGGFALLAMVLLILMLTRLGQSNPLSKCLAMSLFAHCLFAAALSTVQVATSIGPQTSVTHVRIVTSDEAESDQALSRASLRAWDKFAEESLMEPVLQDRSRMPIESPVEPDRQASTGPNQLLTEVSFAHIPEDKTLPRPDRLNPSGSARIGSHPAEPLEADAARQQEQPLLPEIGNSPVRPKQASIKPPAALETSGGLPNTLLDQTTMLPRLSDVTRTPQPESSLLGPADAQPRPTASNAAAVEPGIIPVQRGSPANRAGNTRSAAEASVEAIIDRSRNPSENSTSPEMAVDAALPPLAFARRDSAEQAVPGIYKLRVAPDRAQQAQRHGGTVATEAAVNAALNWLADNQSPDGRWEARQHGAGREEMVLGHDRGGAGAHADTGVTGLALLAFLGAGHTHAEGLYQEAVARGLEFLIRSQGRDGNLAGDAELYAFMYCHGMAAIALSEAYALTRDDRLELPLRRAVSYTLAAQHPAGGGWRYRASDRQGDTSQLGWQLMALKSAKLAGVVIPLKSEEGMARFLRSVAAGKSNGLASYRPGERPSATMTAEALVCRHFLNLPPDNPLAAREAGELLLKELPGTGKPNLYYWYYATLAMHQLGGAYWEQWNAALSRELVDRQIAAGPQSGSWDTNDVWGGYGGRVYTTAMGALCLEVYYRFLPLYERPTASPSR